MRVMLLALSFAVAVSAAASAQTPPAPAPAPPPAVAPAPPVVVDPGPTPPPNFAYSPASRRDPFVDLINRGESETGTASRSATRPEGVGGVLVDEVVVRGVLQGRGGWVAMIGAPTGRTYTVRAGDRLLDGSVRAINATSVILMKEVNDPLSLEKQREVRKYLRGEVK
jgi:Tfp pilus assembly protein PilP